MGFLGMCRPCFMRSTVTLSGKAPGLIISMRSSYRATSIFAGRVQSRWTKAFITDSLIASGAKAHWIIQVSIFSERRLYEVCCLSRRALRSQAEIQSWPPKRLHPGTEMPSLPCTGYGKPGGFVYQSLIMRRFNTHYTATCIGWNPINSLRALNTRSISSNPLSSGNCSNIPIFWVSSILICMASNRFSLACWMFSPQEDISNSGQYDTYILPSFHISWVKLNFIIWPFLAFLKKLSRIFSSRIRRSIFF